MRCGQVEKFVEFVSPAIGLSAGYVAWDLKEHSPLLLPEREDVVAKEGGNDVEDCKAQKGWRSGTLDIGKDARRFEKARSLDGLAGHDDFFN